MSNRIRSRGGYRTLRSFQVATIIYDTTFDFCDRFLDKSSRTYDQMIQAARSGRQNIAEGSRASGASSQSELHLVNVARASLDELLLDYEDFLRHRKLPAWTKDCPEALAVRRLGNDQSDPSDPTDRYAKWLQSTVPAIVANTLICLIHQANYLLDRQLAGLEQQFIREGGYKENLAARRIAHRQKTDQPSAPNCPQCGKPMALRMARKGRHAGTQFWGCSGYPACKGICNL